MTGCHSWESGFFLTELRGQTKSPDLSQVPLPSESSHWPRDCHFANDLLLKMWTMFSIVVGKWWILVDLYAFCCNKLVLWFLKFINVYIHAFRPCSHKESTSFVVDACMCLLSVHKCGWVPAEAKTSVLQLFVSHFTWVLAPELWSSLLNSKCFLLAVVELSF